MNLDELQSVQSRERQTDSLQQLRESFYGDSGTYIQQLRDEREQAAERASDPFDAPEVNRLTDDIKTAEQTVEALYERRVGKVVKMASLAAADMPTEEGGLTREEASLFETLVAAIEDHREQLLDVLAGETTPGAVARTDGRTQPNADGQQSNAESTVHDVDESALPPDDKGSASVEAATILGGHNDSNERDSSNGTANALSDGSPADQSSAGTAIDRQTVRITDDVGAILGVDEREYDLSTDDVVTLPAANADPLVDRDAAELLE